MKHLFLGILLGTIFTLTYYWIDKPYVINENEINLKSIELFDLTNERVSLNQLQDDETYFYFWGTYCAPCLDKLPKLNDLACIEGKTIVCISSEGSQIINNYIDHFQYDCLKFLRIDNRFSEIGIRLIPKMISFQTKDPKLLSRDEIDDLIAESL